MGFHETLNIPMSLWRWWGSPLKGPSLSHNIIGCRGLKKIMHMYHWPCLKHLPASGRYYERTLKRFQLSKMVRHAKKYASIQNGALRIFSPLLHCVNRIFSRIQSHPTYNKVLYRCNQSGTHMDSWLEEPNQFVTGKVTGWWLQWLLCPELMEILELNTSGTTLPKTDIALENRPNTKN